MKTISALCASILLSATVLLGSALAHADVDSRKIKQIADKLKDYTAASKTYTVTPASPLDMLKELAVEAFDEEASEFNYDAEASLGGDSMAWGLINMAKAMSWMRNSEYLSRDEDGNTIENNPRAREAANLIHSLVGTGVVFGAAPHGAVQCGWTYPLLLLIDKEKGKIYTFETEATGC